MDVFRNLYEDEDVPEGECTNVTTPVFYHLNHCMFKNNYCSILFLLLIFMLKGYFLSCQPFVHRSEKAKIVS